MPETLRSDQFVQVGRTKSKSPHFAPTLLTFPIKTVGPVDALVDLGVSQQNKSFGVIESIYINNGKNPSDLRVVISVTNQVIIAPPFSTGTYLVDASEGSSVSLTSLGGATENGSVTFYNYQVQPYVYYTYGLFNGNITVGAVFGSTAIGLAPTKAPVFTSGIDGAGLTRPFLVNATGASVCTDVTSANVALQFDQTLADTAPNAAINAQVTISFLRMQNGKNVAPNTGPAQSGDQSLPSTQLAQYDDVATSGAVENQFSSLRIMADRSLIVQSRATGAPTVAAIASTIASVLLLAVNLNRKGAIIYNDTSNIVYIKFGAAASNASFTTKLYPETAYTLDFGYSGVIHASANVDGGNLLVTEIT
jgi:hypothetical protein